MTFEIFIYIYLFIGFIIGFMDIPKELSWAEEKYPFTSKAYLKELPKTFKGFMLKILSANVLGFIVVISLVSWCILWPLEVVEKIVKGEKK